MKKTNLLIIFVFNVIALSTTAQITFIKTFEGANYEGGKDVKQTTDGGYIIAGHTSSFGAGNKDVYLIKTDATGDTLWTKTFGGTLDDYGNSVQQCMDGGYIITGYTSSFGADSTDVYLIKTDANGDTLWTKTFGGTDDDAGNSVQQCTDGGYIIAGSTLSFGADSTDVYLIKTDATGNTLWTKTFGGTDDDAGNSVQQTLDGGYIISGYATSFGAGGSDVYLIKTDSNGDTLWSKTFGGTVDDKGNFVQQCTDGGYFIVGSSFLSFGATATYLIKTDASGDILWTKTIGYLVSPTSSCFQQTTDGGYIIIGYRINFSARTSYVNLVKTDSNGDVLWAKEFPSLGRISSPSLQHTTDAGYVITGIHNGQAFLIKTDSLGNSCNQISRQLSAITAATLMSNPATIVSSPSTVVTTPGTLVGSGGIINTLCLTLDIYDVSASLNISIFPNPATNHFTIALGSESKKVEVTIADITGKIIYSITERQQQNIDVNTEDFAEGIYVVQIQAADFIATKKLFVKK